MATLILTHVATQPSAWVRASARHIKPNGCVLDLASGPGRNARWLAEQGFQVEAVDRDADALKSMAGFPNISTTLADVENAAWPYAGTAFDAIIACRYLHRPLLPLLPETLAAGGVLIYETFMQGHEAYGRPRNPDFLLKPDELLQAFRSKMQILAFEQGLLEQSPPAVLQRICAIKN